MLTDQITFRTDVRSQDEHNVRDIIVSTGFFTQEETEISVELVRERLQRGMQSGYHFLFAEKNEKTIGYACFGPIPATSFSYDLYWIAVHSFWRGKGIGKSLLQKSEEIIAQLGGQRIYIETSGRETYSTTRAFYLSRGYEEAAVFADFYAPGDAKFVYLKVIKSKS
jgi:ribosomal protein S18 acetylase RimI-like enzyme